jgi:hypothetical protein
MKVSDSAEDMTQESKSAAIQTLEMMLDFAIIEGAELRLPQFVFLLRMARAELTDAIERGSRRSDSRAQN